MLQLVELPHRVRLAGAVAEVEPVVALPLEIEADRDPLPHGADGRRPRQVEARAVGDAVQVDVGECRRVLEVPLEAEQRQRGLAARTEGMARGDATLRLPHILAGAPRDVGRRRGVRVPGELGGGQRAGIVGARIVPVVGHRRQGPAGRERQVKPAVHVADVRPAVLALPVERELRERDQPAARARPELGAGLPLVPRPAGIRVQHVQVMTIEGAAHETHVLGELLGRRGIGPDADHAARGVAEQRGRGAPQHLDAVALPELEIGELALTVGERLRDPVDQHLDAADRERRSRAEPADRDPLVE